MIYIHAFYTKCSSSFLYQEHGDFRKLDFSVSLSFGTVPCKILQDWLIVQPKQEEHCLRLLVCRHINTRTFTDAVGCSAEALFLLSNLLSFEITRKITSSYFKHLLERNTCTHSRCSHVNLVLLHDHNRALLLTKCWFISLHDIIYFALFQINSFVTSKLDEKIH